jgi:RNA polymerase sigma factor (sigma-70 family)
LSDSTTSFEDGIVGTEIVPQSQLRLESPQREIPVLAMSEAPDFAQLLLDHLPLIERAIRSTARRNRLQPADEEDFGSSVMVKLMDKDHAVLRQCRDWSRPKYFFAAVVANCCKDFLIQKSGKKRPSAAAERLGEVALRLERLLRDRYSFPEACEILRTNFKVEMSDAELTALANQLPDHPGRHQEGEEKLQHLAARDLSPEERLLEAEQQRRIREVFAVLTAELAKLPDEDRMLLRLHFEEGWSWKEIAGTLKLDQKTLYPRKDALLAGLKEALQRAGITEEAMLEALQSAGLAFWSKSLRTNADGPSKE